MSKIIYISLFLLGISLAINSQEIRLSSVNGTVQIKQNADAQWSPASNGQKLSTGNYVFTGFKSTAIIQTPNAKIEVKPLTQMSVASLIEDDNSASTELKLNYGKIKSTVNKIENKKVFFKVRSANSTASVRGTIFIVGDNEIVVEDGSVEVVTVLEDSILVQKNESAYIPSDNDLIQDQYAMYLDHYYVNTNPLGLSDSEDGDNFTNLTGGNGTGKGTIIININVIK